MPGDAKPILRVRCAAAHNDGTHSVGPWRDASKDECPACQRPLIDHSIDQFKTCLKQSDLEHIRHTGKPIIETVNGVTRQVDVDYPSPLWGEASD
jgi:hypothetical protein